MWLMHHRGEWLQEGSVLVWWVGDRINEGAYNRGKRRRRVFIPVVARQVNRPSPTSHIHLQKPWWLHICILSSLWLFLKSFYIWAYGRYFKPFPGCAGMQNALKPRSSSSAGGAAVFILCAIYEAVLLCFPLPALVWLLHVSVAAVSLHHSVLQPQIYSDSSPQIQCTLALLFL